jgi:hypothetical protein
MGSDLQPDHRVLYLRGSDDDNGISGSGSAELLDHGTLEIAISVNHGDDATLNADRDPSSTRC